MVTSVALALTRPTMTRDAPTSSATLMMVARVRAVPEGSCSRVEGSEAFVASDHRHAATGQRRRQADGRALAEPANPGIEFVLGERHDQGAAAPPPPGACAGRLMPAASSIRLSPAIRRRQRVSRIGAAAR